MRFRKKPVVITAEFNDGDPVIIHTLEGDMVGNTGDWIITGIGGEKYPCKSDIFYKTYEPEDDEAFEKWWELYLEKTGLLVVFPNSPDHCGLDCRSDCIIDGSCNPALSTKKEN